MIQLDEKNWKCANCSRFISLREPCNINGDNVQYPDVRFELSDDCGYFIDENLGFNVEVTDSEIKVSYTTPKRTYTGTVDKQPDWDETTVKVAIIKAKEKIMLEVASMEDADNAVEESVPDIDETESNMENVKEDINELIAKLNGLLNTNNNVQNDAVEQTLEGETEIAWIERVTSWKRVLNAARRTIGREQSSNEPSDSWKSKILLAEHSPIRLLEYDFGWKKIRQWVTAHLVRHHEGCEKFVHSQRGDRRELPCERDRLPQGARNDMDMTANAQALISISRKRCCMCASKETRDAWGQVLNELEKIDPVLRSKCVRECVYRGFCPEWMSKCKYCYSPAYWLELKNYRNTVFGKDETWKFIEQYNCEVSNIGRVRNHNLIIIKENADANGAYVDLYGNGTRTYIRDLMDATYGTAGLDYVDGNKYNNALSNLK